SLTCYNTFENSSTFSIDAGALNAYNTFSNTGTIEGCNGGGLDLINASVTNMGDLSPGCSPGILNIIGDYANGGGDLNIEIGGTAVETEYDRLNVSGNANLSGGNINISLVNSYSPQIGDIFTILDATTLSGAFSTPTDPFVFAGVNWGISYSPGDGTIILEVLSVLPLELLDFEVFAESESNRLDWRSASETKFSHFEIERSADGATWAKIGSVPGLGNTTAEQFYQFTDKQPLPLGYYRLRMVDLDGSAAFSKIVSADRQKQASKLRISPNPFSDQLFINLYAQEAATAFVSLTDVAGKVIWQMQIAVTEGSNRLHFDLPEIPQGIYMLQMKMPGLQIAERVARM
ncbi:MAG: T9SS type A sorting domain-containing protein, partial [Saprospiraceae bacterium]|nr:T9SS type A sorting domain-containing protein [Saprospiraceae bacterium]